MNGNKRKSSFNLR